MNETVKRYKTTMTRLGATLLVWYAMFLGLTLVAELVSGFFVLLAPARDALVVSSILYAAAYMLAFSLAAIFYRLINRQSYDCPMRFTPRLPKNSLIVIIAGIGCSFSFAILNSIIVSSLGLPSAPEIFTYPTEFSPDYSIVLQFISVALVPAFCEELLFRGVVLSNLMPYGKASAIIISAILFGLMHGNLYQFIYTTVAGIIIGTVYVLTESIWCSILIHMINNSLSLLQIAIEDRFSLEHSWILVLIYECVIMFLGVVFAFILLKKKRKNSAEDSDEKEMANIGELSFSGKLGIRDVSRGFLTPTVLAFVIISWVMGIAAVSVI